MIQAELITLTLKQWHSPRTMLLQPFDGMLGIWTDVQSMTPTQAFAWYTLLNAAAALVFKQGNVDKVSQCMMTGQIYLMVLPPADFLLQIYFCTSMLLADCRSAPSSLRPCWQRVSL